MFKLHPNLEIIGITLFLGVVTWPTAATAEGRDFPTFEEGLPSHETFNLTPNRFLEVGQERLEEEIERLMQPEIPPPTLTVDESVWFDGGLLEAPGDALSPSVEITPIESP